MSIKKPSTPVRVRGFPFYPYFFKNLVTKFFKCGTTNHPTTKPTPNCKFRTKSNTAIFVCFKLENMSTYYDIVINKYMGL